MRDKLDDEQKKPLKIRRQQRKKTRRDNFNVNEEEQLRNYEKQNKESYE